MFVSDILDQALRYGLQCCITCSMPIGIIETLESIQIEKHHGERPVVAVRECNRMSQAIIEQFSVGKPRERVMQGARLGITRMLLGY